MTVAYNDLVNETNGLADGRAYHAARTVDGPVRRVDWTTRGLQITRLRLLSDPGFPMWDVSYCHGMLNGEPVDVDLPFHQLTKGRIKTEIVNWAREDRVYAKGLGILDCISTLN